MSIYLSIYIYTSTYTIIYIAYKPTHPCIRIHPSIHPPTRMQRHTHTYMYTHNSEIFRDLWIYIYTCTYSQASSRRPPTTHGHACTHTKLRTHACTRPPMCRCTSIHPSIYLFLRACIARPAANRLACSAVSRRLAASVEKRASAGQPPPMGTCLCRRGPACQLWPPHMPAPLPRVHEDSGMGHLTLHSVHMYRPCATGWRTCMHLPHASTMLMHAIHVCTGLRWAIMPWMHPWMP